MRIIVFAAIAIFILAAATNAIGSCYVSGALIDYDMNENGEGDAVVRVSGDCSDRDCRIEYSILVNYWINTNVGGFPVNTGAFQTIDRFEDVERGRFKQRIYPSFSVPGCYGGRDVDCKLVMVEAKNFKCE
nr:hypothetical protein [Gammaproteobacteria bacterium]